MSCDGGSKGGLSTPARGLCAGLSDTGCGDANLFFHAGTLFHGAETLMCRAANLVSRIPNHDSRDATLFCSFANLVSSKQGFLFRNRTLMCRAEGLVFRKPDHESRKQTLVCEKTGLDRRATGLVCDATRFVVGAYVSRHRRRAMLRLDATPLRSAMKPGPVLDTGRSHAKCPKPGFRSNVFK
jgi:hypothetical protein